MDRKDFIRQCGLVCTGSAALGTILQACNASRLLTGTISGDNLVVPASDFEIRNGNKVYYKKYIVVQHDILQYPVCIYRFSNDQYSALWMRCTHQGTELQVFGDKLQCPAHGSEFDSKGGIQNGPADAKLRTFEVTLQQGFLHISLKAV
jgi:Rieske Fe-S protein